MKRLTCLPISCLLLGCTSLVNPPQTIGARNAGYSYIALDPLPVDVDTFTRCPSRNAGAPADVLDALPDIASRVAIRTIEGDANVALGPFSAGGGGRQYEVTIDYTATDTTNLTFQLPAAATNTPRGGVEPTTAELSYVKRIDPAEAASAGGEKVVIPVYVGVGLRMRAHVEVLKGKVNIASLGALAAGAQAERVAGDIEIQTLGINGPKVTLLISIPSELNPTTVQNAIVSLGSIRSILYSPETQPRARVTGIYYPFEKPNQTLVNAIVSELARKAIPWRPCQSG
jgi:hypothetical protein